MVYYRELSFYCALYNCIFYKLKVCGNPVLNKSISIIFLASLFHFVVSVSHFGNSYYFRLYYYHYICYGDLWCLMLQWQKDLDSLKIQIIVSILLAQAHKMQIGRIFPKIHLLASHWTLKMSHNESIYTMETGKHYKSEISLFFSFFSFFFF